MVTSPKFRLCISGDVTRDVVLGDDSCSREFFALGCFLLVVDMRRDPFNGYLLVVPIAGGVQQVIDDFAQLWCSCDDVSSRVLM